MAKLYLYNILSSERSVPLYTKFKILARIERFRSILVPEIDQYGCIKFFFANLLTCITNLYCDRLKRMNNLKSNAHLLLIYLLVIYSPNS